MGKRMGWLGLKDWAGCGFLARLSRDTRANTIAIVAAALIPLCGMIGGGFDLSRMYIVKTRLQHACDAGALAGRKSMGGGTWAQSSYMPRTMAERFFDANIASDAYGSNTITKSYSENAGKVTGTASAILPMTLMRVLGKTTETLTVTCESEMRLPNTDVMFVLDNTGSMASKARATDTMSKIDGLKQAVRCFYEIVARLDTVANCDAGAPSGGTGSQVQIRFGFVPYSTNVNVGRLLPTDWMADQANYNTRAQIGNSGNFRYGLMPVNVSGMKNGTGYNTTFDVQAGPNSGIRSTYRVNWTGCVEERKTAKTTDYTPIPSDALDLDVDTAPTPGDPDTQWRPGLPEITYMRKLRTSWDELNRDEVSSTSDTYYRYLQLIPYGFNYYCPAEARKLQQWPDASAFDAYVSSLTPTGNTYHDIGMIWGARLMSPDGMFKSENQFTPQGGEIQRHMIFMTDGDAVSSNCDYNAYGIHFYDRRQTDDVGNWQNCMNGTSLNSLTGQINSRLEALCDVVKNKNITLWVVSFGGGNLQSTEDRLERCASPGRYFLANDSAALQRTFKSIADQISALRLIK
ncbi:TadE/TadG family type IV pilus assembly protein [Sphingomonas yantingensis]|nr:TadE/TadG family type IV pilus assembly protein [Sphingomonas yantingensis]